MQNSSFTFSKIAEQRVIETGTYHDVLNFQVFSPLIFASQPEFIRKTESMGNSEQLHSPQLRRTQSVFPVYGVHKILESWSIEGGTEIGESGIIMVESKSHVWS